MKKKFLEIITSKISLYIILTIVSCCFVILFLVLDNQQAGTVFISLGASIFSSILFSISIDIADYNERNKRNKNIRSFVLLNYIFNCTFLLSAVTTYFNFDNERFETKKESYEIAISRLKDSDKVVGNANKEKFIIKFNELSKAIIQEVNSILASKPFLLSEKIFTTKEIYSIENSKNCLEGALKAKNFYDMGGKIEDFFKCLSDLKECKSILDGKIIYL